MEDQKKVTTLNDQQHEALAALCTFRHKLHCNQTALFNAESSDYDFFIKKLSSEYNECIGNELNSVGIANRLSYNLESLPTSHDYDADYNEDEPWYNDHEAAEAFVITFAEQINNDIEALLRRIDKEHGTNYCPTGITRFL